MTTDTKERGPETGEGQPRPEPPQPAPTGTTRHGTEPAVPPRDEGVERPPFPTRGDIDTEC